MNEELTNNVGLALLRDFYWVELGVRSYLRAQGNPEFSRSEGIIIANITLGFVRPSEISRQLGVSRQAVHQQLQQMRLKGIVTLEPDPTDRRGKIVRITDLARKMNNDGIAAMTIIWNELESRLGARDLRLAARVLTADWGPPMQFETASRE
jgi:DNA-binding MarR family transcriptional regulator